MTQFFSDVWLLVVVAAHIAFWPVLLCAITWPVWRRWAK